MNTFLMAKIVKKYDTGFFRKGRIMPTGFSRTNRHVNICKYESYENISK